MKHTKQFLLATRNAFFGILNAPKGELNLKIMWVVGTVVFMIAFILPLTNTQRAIIIGTIFATISLETLNTALEKTLDLLHPNKHPQVKLIKDITAGAVLTFSIGAVIIGLLILFPYLLKMF